MTVHDPDLRPADVPPPASDPTEAGGILTIDLAAIEANWKTLASMTVPVECAAVVKADGYGCGLEPVTRTLSREGCSTFFVADVADGRRVRAVAADAAIYVLNGLIPGSAQAFAADYLRPVINSATELAEWDAFVATRNWRGGAALHVDTGMNRLGITPEEAVAIAPRLQSENHGFTLVMSHLACAEIPDHPMNDRQIRLFREIRILYRGVASSLANSSGIFLGGGAYCDLVRPGVALYGVNPTPGKTNPMRPVVELKGGAVSDGFALLDCAHLDDAALELHHRAHEVGLARGGIDAVKRDTGPNEVAIRALAEEYARGIGERGRHAAVEHANVAKQPHLSSIHRVIGRLGAGEMAHHQRETVIFGLQAGRDGGRLLERDAEPVHAGVDVEGCAATPVLGGDEGVPFGKFGGAVDDRPQIVGCESLRRAWHHSVEHVDGGVGRNGAYLPPF